MQAYYPASRRRRQPSATALITIGALIGFGGSTILTMMTPARSCAVTPMSCVAVERPSQVQSLQPYSKIALVDEPRELKLFCSNGGAR